MCDLLALCVLCIHVKRPTRLFPHSNRRRTDGGTPIAAIKRNSLPPAAWPSCASTAMSAFSAGTSGKITVKTTCGGRKRFPFSVIPSSAAEPSPAQGTARSVWGIRRFPLPHGCINSSIENDGQDISSSFAHPHRPFVHWLTVSVCCKKWNSRTGPLSILARYSNANSDTLLPLWHVGPILTPLQF